MAAACSGAGEMITFQVGNYSNFVGAHYWNLQEGLLRDGTIEHDTNNELNHDILFRKSVNVHTGQHACRPRLIAFDLKENVRNFAITDESLTDDGEETLMWEGTVEKYDRSLDNVKKSEANVQTPNAPKSEDTFSSWCAFTSSQFHDKSLQTIESFHNDACGSFDNFGSGKTLFESPKFRDDFEDRVHFFAEECDRLQGFQIFSDIHNGFAGLTSSILLNLADDYAKKNRLCFAMMPALLEDDTKYTFDRAMLNVLLSFGKFVDAGCQLIPLSLRDSYGLKGGILEFPYMEYKANSHYHTSAILASAIDTGTLPYRFADKQSITFNSFIDNLSSGGRKISAMSLGLPIPASSTLTLNDLLKGTLDFIIPLTPDIVKFENTLTQSTVVRGIPTHLLKTENYELTAKQMSALFQYKSNSGRFCPTYVAKTPSITTQSFPDIFNPTVTQVGCVIENYNRPLETKVQKTSVMAGLVNCQDITKPLEAVLQGTDKTNVMKYPGFLEAGIEGADIEGCREDVRSIVDNYQSDYEL